MCWLCRQSNQLRAGRSYASIEEVTQRAEQCGVKSSDFFTLSNVIGYELWYELKEKTPHKAV